MLGVSCHWLYFTLRNTDIMAALNKAPLLLKAVDSRHFKGTIFGVKLTLEVLGEADLESSGEIDIVADVRMPFRLGRTHTVAHYRYRPVEENITTLDLQLDLETTGLFMAIYAALLRHRIDDYLNRVMSDNERAAILVQENDAALKDILSDSQRERIDRFRATYGERFLAKPKGSQEEPRDMIVSDKPLWEPELIELTELYSRFQRSADKLENELVRIRETRDAVAALLIARRMLEVIVAHVCQRNLQRTRGTEPLSSIIDKIIRAECVPEYVTTSMSNLNRLSTYGAHPKDFSPRQVREALMALCSIMEWYACYCQDGEVSNRPKPP